MSTSHWLHATPDEGTTTLLMPLCTAACKQGQFGWGTIRHKALVRQDCCQRYEHLLGAADAAVRGRLRRVVVYQ